MTRDEWKSRSRAFEASVAALLAAGHDDACYYLSGIAVECALKAKIARRFRANDIPDRRFVADLHQKGHDLPALVRFAGLDMELAEEERSSAAFRTNWEIVRRWSVDSRYLRWSQNEAATMLDAIAQRRTGVLSWIRRHW